MLPSFIEGTGAASSMSIVHAEMVKRIPDLHNRAVVWLRAQDDLIELPEEIPGMSAKVKGKYLLCVDRRGLPDMRVFVGLEMSRQNMFISDIPQVYLHIISENDSQKKESAVYHLYARGGLSMEIDGKIVYFTNPSDLHSSVMFLEKLIFSVVPVARGTYNVF